MDDDSIPLTPEEFDLIYRALRDTVNDTGIDQESMDRVLNQQNEAFALLAQIKNDIEGQ